jgi:hypothetical protein
MDNNTIATVIHGTLDTLEVLVMVKAVPAEVETWIARTRPGMPGRWDERRNGSDQIRSGPG